jgi:dihydrofolate reductase
MRVTIIVAADLAGGIGHEGAIPWRLPEDLRRFKALTMGKPIVMGRKTHESIGRALPGRRNIVLSRNPDYRPAKDCVRLGSLGDAMGQLEAEGCDEMVIAGGEAVYEEALLSQVVDTIHLTQVLGLYPADTRFPDEWKRVAWQVDVEGHLSGAPATKESAEQPACVFLRLERL